MSTPNLYTGVIMNTGKKLIFAITEPVIDKLAISAIERIMNSIEETISEVVQYELLPKDVVNIITDLLTEDENKTLTKIEIDLLQIKGSLNRMVRERVYELLPERIQKRAEELADERK